MKGIIGILSLLILCACSSRGFNREAMRLELGATNQQVTDEDIKKAFELKPQLPKPFKIGVYFVDNEQKRWDLRWNSVDKDAILSLADELKKSGEVSQLFLLNDSVVTGKDIKSIRLAAAHHGADAILVINSTSATDQYMNRLGLSYILVLPALFVPGTMTDALYITRAALWDVRNEYLYMAVESESVKRKRAALINSDELVELIKAKRDSIAGLRSEILRMMNELTKK